VQLFLPRQASVLDVNACGPVKQVEAEHLQVTPSRRASCSLQWRRPFGFSHTSRARVINVSVMEPKAEEPKLNCLLEPKLRIAASNSKLLKKFCKWLQF